MPFLTFGMFRDGEQSRCFSQRNMELSSQDQKGFVGGDITYHGPGQLVGYPILSIVNKLGSLGHVRNVEQLVIDTLAAFGVVTAHPDGTYALTITCMLLFVGASAVFARLRDALSAGAVRAALRSMAAREPERALAQPVLHLVPERGAAQRPRDDHAQGLRSGTHP